MLFRSLFSRTVRKAGQVIEAAEKILNHQRDELPEKNLAEIEQGIATLKELRRTGTIEQIKAGMDRLDETAQKWFKVYPNASTRENIEGFFTMAVLLFAFRQFFAQPMEIPTGSAQPTFWGITGHDLRGKPDVKIPTGLEAVWDRWIKGDRYIHVVARADGAITAAPKKATALNLGNFHLFEHQLLTLSPVGPDGLPIPSTEETYDIPISTENFFVHMGLVDESLGQIKKAFFKKGEDIIKVKVSTGDRLFVNCLTYNFRRPHRGETVVFKSSGIPGITQGTHYIKRLIAMDGEEVRIGDDRHVYINGRKLDSSTPGFENVYSFDPKTPPVADHYSGHVNQKVWIATNGRSGAKLFPDGDSVFKVKPHHFLCFGDNTMNSNDGRDWGDFPEEKVIGKSLFVFWPFTERWGIKRH
ncbi:MAG TPA: signal peptidase I [Candidatus Limnocylindria bacterium]|nr:signal peptidase I [Candidatus Limnocylindria bacterium]